MVRDTAPPCSTLFPLVRLVELLLSKFKKGLPLQNIQSGLGNRERMTVAHCIQTDEQLSSYEF